jgi:hypothetical protein
MTDPLDESDPLVRSGGQTFAALPAAALQNGASGVGGHALEKTVGPFSLEISGLERSLHDLPSSLDGISNEIRSILRVAAPGRDPAAASVTLRLRAPARCGRRFDIAGVSSPSGESRTNARRFAEAYCYTNYFALVKTAGEELREPGQRGRRAIATRLL